MSSRGVQARLWSLIVMLFWVACGDSSPITQVIVEVDAEDSVKELTKSMRLVIEGGDDIDKLEGRTTRGSQPFESPAFPRTARLRPKGGDNTRAFVLTATALDENGELVSEARLISSYVPGETRRARLLVLGNACLRKQCEDDTLTCSKGGCVPATIPPDALPKGGNTTIKFPDPDDGGPEPDDGGSDPEDGGPDAGDTGPDAAADAGADASADGGDAGERLGSPCPDKNGQLRCIGTNSVVSMICSAGTWTESAGRCKASERCDSRPGQNQGLCLDIVSGCADKSPGDQLCRGNQRLTCGVDRVTADTVDCPSGQVCVQQGRETSCMSDVDECAMNTDNCDTAPEACFNTFGSFKCECPLGYSGAGVGMDGCVDKDECAPGPAAACGVASATCNNTAGSYTCTCPAGYAGSGSKACTNINECANGAVAACGTGASGCTDTLGSYQCTCATGYMGTGTKACTDVPNCAGGAAAACGLASAICSDTPGSYACTCPAGYMGTGTTRCVDSDECLAGSQSACGVAGATCTNSPGSYSCACPSGYNGMGTKACMDINECSAGPAATCAVLSATCNNTLGSYTCTCPTGYTGNGTRACTVVPATVMPRPQCMTWLVRRGRVAVPAGALLGGFELTFDSYPGTPFTNRHFVCQVESNGARYPAKLTENSQDGTTWGCYAHNGTQALDLPDYSVLTLNSGCTTSWVAAGSSLPTNAVVAGDNGAAMLVPCMAPVSAAPFPLSSMDPYSAHPNDTHLGWVSSAGPYRCRYEYVQTGFEATTFQVLVWNQ